MGVAEAPLCYIKLIGNLFIMRTIEKKIVEDPITSIRKLKDSISSIKNANKIKEVWYRGHSLSENSPRKLTLFSRQF